MPIYTYDCAKCGAEVEQVVSYARRDEPMCHEECGGELQRRGVERFTLGKPGFQPAAILSDGRKVPGHFGKAARKKRGGWHRP